MNGEQETFFSDKDSVLRRILEESPLSNSTFSASTDIVDDDSHKHRARATKTSLKRRSRKDKDKEIKPYPIGARDIARLLLHDEREVLQMRKLLDQTVERMQSESKRAGDAERRASEAETRMLDLLNSTRETQREMLRERDVLRAYQAQVEAAKNEILKAQKELDTLAEEKYKVEQEAARERSKYRQLQKETEIKQALERGRLEGFVDGRKEGWHLGKEYARGSSRTWRNAEYYSQGEEDSASIITSSSTGPPPLTGPPLDPIRSVSPGGPIEQAPITMPVPEIPAKTLPRSMTPHGHRRVASAMQSPKSRTSGKSHRRSSLNVAMPVPNTAPGPGPSGLRQNTLSTEDDYSSIKSPSRAFSTKTPLRPSSRHSSTRAPSIRPDVLLPPSARTPLNPVISPQASQPTQPVQLPTMQPPQFPEPVPPVRQPSPRFGTPSQPQEPPIRPVPSPAPRTPSHSPIAPLPGGYIPVLDANGRISLPPPHEVDPFPPSPTAPPEENLPPLQHNQQFSSRPSPVSVNVHLNGPSSVKIEPAVQAQQPPGGFPQAFNPVDPPTQDFTIPVPKSPWQPPQPPILSNGAGFPPPFASPAARAPSIRSERRSPRSPMMNMPLRSSPMQTLNDQFNNLDIAAELFEPDEDGQIPGSAGYVPPRGAGFARPLSAIQEGGSTTAESPKRTSRNASAASFRVGGGQVPKFPQFAGGGNGYGATGSMLLNKPQPPTPFQQPSPIRGHSPILPPSIPLEPNGMGLPGNHGIYNDPREYGEFVDLSNPVSPSRQQLAGYLRPAPSDHDVDLRDDVSIRTSTSGTDRLNKRRYKSRDVEHLEKHAAMYDTFGTGRRFPDFNFESERESPETNRTSRTPVPRRPSVADVPQVTLLEPSPPKPTPRAQPNRPTSRASSRRHSFASIRSVDDPDGDIAPFIPPSPSNFPNPPLQDFRIVKNSPAVPLGFVQQTPSVAPQSRMPTVGRPPATLPDRTPAMGSGSAFNNPPPMNMNASSFGFGATPMRTALPFSVSSTVRNLPGGGTQNAPSVRATPARMPLTVNTNFNSSTTSVRKLPAMLPNRHTGRTIPTELPTAAAAAAMNFETTTGPTSVMHPPAGFVPQPSNSPAMYESAAPMGDGGMDSNTTPHYGQGMFMGRTPTNLAGGLPSATTSAPISNAANFNTGGFKESAAPQSTTKEPARLPGSRRPSISVSATGKTPARLPASMGGGGESSQRIQGQQPTPAQPPLGFQGFTPFNFGMPFTFGGPPPVETSNAYKPTPASGVRTMSNARPPARLPNQNQNSTINTPARLPLPASNVNTPWTTGAPLTNSRPPATLLTPIGQQQSFIPNTQAVPTSANTPGRMGMGFGLPTGGSPATMQFQQYSPFQGFDNNPMQYSGGQSRPVSGAQSRRPVSSFLAPPGGQVTDTGNVTIESASDED